MIARLKMFNFYVFTTSGNVFLSFHFFLFLSVLFSREVKNVVFQIERERFRKEKSSIDKTPNVARPRLIPQAYTHPRVFSPFLPYSTLLPSCHPSPSPLIPYECPLLVLRTPCEETHAPFA